jgi:hypothetical protein
MEWGGMDWIHLAQDRDHWGEAFPVSMVISLWFP